MGRRGRPRKNTKREPSGRVERDTPDKIRSVALDQRRAVVGNAQASNELAESHLGILHIRGYIKDARLVSAGKRYAGIFSAHARLVGIPKPTANACAMGQSGGGGVIQMEEHRIKGIKQRYNDASSALRACGKESYKITTMVVIDEALPAFEIETFIKPLNDGLRALAFHFEIG